MLEKIQRGNQCWDRFQRYPSAFVLDTLEGDRDGCAYMLDQYALDSELSSRPRLDHVEPSVVCTGRAISGSGDTFTGDGDYILSGGSR